MSSVSVRFNSFLFFIRFSMNIGGTLVPLVGLDGLEPSTSRLSGVRSNHLSYRPFSLGDSPFVSITLPFLLNPRFGCRPCRVGWWR